MKKIILITLFSALCIGAEPVKSSAPSMPRFRHIQTSEGEILATIDSKDGSIEYKKDPKLAVKELIGVVDNVVAQCQKELSEAKAKPPVKMKK